jgi:DNA polymerase III sliding clamp (beta) subunit (PCNA family)
LSTTIIEGTEVQAVTAVTFTIPALRELTAATVAAGKDDTLPTLTGVRVEWSKGLVRFIATDRYRLAVIEYAHEDTGCESEGAVLVPAKELAAYVKALPKTGRRSGGWERVIMVPGDGEVTFTCDTADGTVSRTIRTLDGEYPKYAPLIPGEDRFTATDSISCNPVFLADLSKLPNVKNGPVSVTFTGEGRPMLWTGKGDVVSWQYLLMPVRLSR